MLRYRETCLRPYEERDLPTLTALRNDPALQATLLALPRGSSSDAVRAWVARATGDDASLFFVVSNERTGQGIGFVQLVRLDFVHGHGQLGIALAPEARGQGHGAAAIRLIEEHARDVFNLRKVVLNVLGSNAHAARLYERVGYTKVGTLRAHFYHREAHHDVVVMEKLLSEHRIDS